MEMASVEQQQQFHTPRSIIRLNEDKLDDSYMNL